METLINFSLFSPVYIPLVIAMAAFVNAEKKNYAKKFLSFVLLNISFLFFGLYFFLSGDYEFYAYILPIHVISLLLIYPSIYIYVRYLVEPFKSAKSIYIHLLAIVPIIMNGVIFYFFLNQQERVYFVSEARYNPEGASPLIIFLYFCRWVNILILGFQIAFYGIKILKVLKKYQQAIHNLFSNTEGINLSSIRTINRIIITGSVASIIFYSINPIKVFGNNVVLIIPLAFISFAIWALGIVGLRQKMIPHSIIQKPIIETQSETDNSQKLYKKLMMYFITEKPFLNPDLKIDDLSLALGTNRTHLSNAVNQYSGKNFNRFVNNYRVEQINDYIEKKQGKVSKLELCEISGFGSVRTLERNFKDTTGESINQYLQK